MNLPPDFSGVFYGYARVSTEEQNLDLQIAALKDAGVAETHIFTEKKTGRNMDRPQLERVVKLMRKGDCLVVWRLDRLGRSVRGLVDMIENLRKKGIHFRSLRDPYFDTTAMGMMLFNIMASMAQLESDMNSERTKAGIAQAKKRGVKFGRQHYILGYPKRLKRFTELWASGRIPDGDMSFKDIIDEMNAVDRKAPQIKSTGSYGNWKAKGFPGFERPERKQSQGD